MRGEMGNNSGARACAAFRSCLIYLSLLVLLSFSRPADADWVNLGGAEVAPNIVQIHVQDTGVKVILEVFVGDLETFGDLVPGEWLAETGRGVTSDAERLADFAQGGLRLSTGDGKPLSIERRVAERRLRVDRASPLAGKVDPYTGRTIPRPPEDPRVLYFELFYEFDQAHPDTLVIEPPLDENGAVAATIGVVVFHHAVPVIDFRYLSAPAQLELDWDDPWYSRFDSPNLRRHHQYPRMTYLYAEPYEIRHEALVRVRDALELAEMDAMPRTLSSDEAEALAAEMAERIGAATPLTIEGVPVTADFDRSAFMRIGMRGLELLQPGEEVDVDADILGLIWSVPTDGLPKQAELEWTWFDDTVQSVAGYAIDAAGPFLFPLTPEDRRVTWKNHFKVNPYPDIAAVDVEMPKTPLSWMIGLVGTALLGVGIATWGMMRERGGGRRLVLAGSGLALLALAAIPLLQGYQSRRLPEMDDAKLTALTGDLLNNVYRAFDFRTEDQVYDRLALTLDGEVLSDVYLAQRQALRIERAGGADARVEALETTAVEQIDSTLPGALRLKADWIVRGSVGHWGHIHRRTNGYEAEISIAPVDGRWKIREFDVLSQERLQ